VLCRSGDGFPEFERRIGFAVLNVLTADGVEQPGVLRLASEGLLWTDHVLGIVCHAGLLVFVGRMGTAAISDPPRRGNVRLRIFPPQTLRYLFHGAIC
jgi:hypothetical protein